MRMLIIAGPYEADRLRREAAAAGVESVAIEPSGSLSGWISATDPALILLVPGILHPDVGVAVEKVRSASAGHIPLLLVGEPAEEPMFAALAEGVLSRPVTELSLRGQIRAITGAEVAVMAVDEVPSGPVVAAAIATESSNPSSRPRALRPLVAEGSGPAQLARPAAENVAQSQAAATARSRAAASLTLFDHMAYLIDAAFDEAIDEAIDEAVDEGMAEAVDEAVDEGMAMSAQVAALIPPSSSDEEDEQHVYFVGNDASAPETLEGAAQRRLPPVVDETEGGAGSEGTTRVPTAPSGSGPASLPALVAGGTLGEGSPPLDLASLFGRLSLIHASGRLVLTATDEAPAPPAERFIVFLAGRAAWAGSSRKDERLGAMLVREGRLPADVVSRCGDDAFAAGKRLGEVLVERGHLDAAELPQVVRRHYEELVYVLLAWEPAHYRFVAEDGPSTEDIVLSLPPAILLLEGLRRSVPLTRTLARLGDETAHYRLRSAHGTAELFDEMGLSAEERRLTLFFDGVRSLAAVRDATLAPWLTVVAIARVLMVLDRLDLVSPTQVGGDLDATEAYARDPELDRARVLATTALVEEADYFRLLGVGREATREEIARAHQMLRQTLGPEALDPSVLDNLSEEVEAIREVLDEGWRVLGDDQRRRRYRAALGPETSPRTSLLAPRETPRDEGRAPAPSHQERS